ncbi:MAG: ATP-binding cassette domain-containing protein, partial [Aquificaceae bacterium]
TALVFLQTPLMETQKGFMEVRASLPVVKRIKEVLELKEEEGGQVSLKDFKEALKIEGMRVRVRGDRVLLEDINLTVKRGEKVGIMGDTGSGKSTLLRALAGFLPYEGSAKIDGVEISQIKREDLRELLLLLSQEPFVFPGSVRENLVIGGEGNQEELWKALSLAGCDFVKDLDQQIEPKSLSGGERQRLALARVFLKNPQILLLDEATSALDAKREEEILNNLFSHFSNKTLILVAHRFSNLLRCDRVAVLKEGRIVFEGKPKEAIEYFLRS